MYRGFVTLAILVFLPVMAVSQPYAGGQHTRHRFAQLNVGVDARILPGGKTYSHTLTPAGITERMPLGTAGETRLIIGGTHFWGHADFFIAIPVYTTSKTSQTGPETGARIYPWSISDRHLRPYGGIGVLPVIFRQEDGASVIRIRTPLSAGFTFNARQNLVDLGVSWFYRNSTNYYFSPTISGTVRQYPIAISVGYKWMLETTISAEKGWQSGATKMATDTLAKRRRLNGFTIAAGPSSAFFMRKSAHNETIPYIADHTLSGIFADVGLGYYWHGADVQANLAWRSYASDISAYGTQQTASRRSLAIEGYKFLGDYHGFVPFAGPALSYEHLSVTETNATAVTHAGKRIISPGLTFGWDIRPNRLQALLLRTNLRYFPFLAVKMPDGKDVALDALEVNFIQLVIFPGRLRGLR